MDCDHIPIYYWRSTKLPWDSEAQGDKMVGVTSLHGIGRKLDFSAASVWKGRQVVAAKFIDAVGYGGTEEEARTARRFEDLHGANLLVMINLVLPPERDQSGARKFPTAMHLAVAERALFETLQADSKTSRAEPPATAGKPIRILPASESHLGWLPRSAYRANGRRTRAARRNEMKAARDMYLSADGEARTRAAWMKRVNGSGIAFVTYYGHEDEVEYFEVAVVHDFRVIARRYFDLDTESSRVAAVHFAKRLGVVSLLFSQDVLPPLPPEERVPVG